MKQVRTRDIEGLAYDEFGAAEEPVIFVHGSAADYQTWAAQVDVLLPNTMFLFTVAVHITPTHTCPTLQITQLKRKLKT